MCWYGWRPPWGVVVDDDSWRRTLLRQRQLHPDLGQAFLAAVRRVAASTFRYSAAWRSSSFCLEDSALNLVCGRVPSSFQSSSYWLYAAVSHVSSHFFSAGAPRLSATPSMADPHACESFRLAGMCTLVMVIKSPSMRHAAGNK